MNFPKQKSRGEQILKAFMRGAMTIYQGADIHGEFVTKVLPNGVDHAKMVDLYCDLVERGCLVREGIKYRLSQAAKNRLEADAAAPVPPRSIVPPRVRDFLSRPLFIGFSPAFPWRVSL